VGSKVLELGTHTLTLASPESYLISNHDTPNPADNTYTLKCEEPL